VYLNATPKLPRRLPPLPALQRASAEQSWSVNQFLHWLGGRWAGAAATNPYKQNIHVYRAINVFIQTVLALPLELKRGDRNGPEITSGPAFELFRQPERGSTKQDLIESVLGNLLESGEAHIFDPDAGNVRPRTLIVAGRAEMTPIFLRGADELHHWDYRAAGGQGRPVAILPEQHAYAWLWNPYDKWRGLSPAEVFALGLKADYLAQQHSLYSLANGARPGGLYKFTDRLNDDERREFLRRIEDRHQGPTGANLPGVIEGNVDWIDTGQNNVDLELIDLRKLTRDEAYEAYGVPPILGGILEGGHYDVADGAQEIFLWGPVAYFIKKITSTFNVLVLPRVEESVVFDIGLGQHYVLQRIERKKVEQYNQLVEHGVPPRTAAQWLGLPFENVPHAEIGFMTTGVQTTDDTVAGIGPLSMPEEEETERRSDEETEEEEEQEEATERRSDEATEGKGSAGPWPAQSGPWPVNVAASLRTEQRAEEQQIRAQIPKYRQRVRAHFLRQERELIRRLRREVRDEATKRRKDEATKSPWRTAAEDDDYEAIVKRVLLKISQEQQRLRRIAREVGKRAIEQTLKAELKRLGIPKDRIDAIVAKAMNGRYIERILRLKELTLAKVEVTSRARLRRQLLEGLKKQETVGQLSERIRQVVKDPVRANRIARTEAGKAVSTARFVAAGAAGATGKGWLHGRNPRPTHLKAQQDYHPRNNAIPMSEAFAVGSDRLMYPRDPAGSAAEVINCNCVLVTVKLKKGSDGATERRSDAAELVNVIGPIEPATAMESAA